MRHKEAISYKIPNKAIRDLICKTAKSNGVRVCPTLEVSDLKYWNHAVLDLSSTDGLYAANSVYSFSKKVTLEELLCALVELQVSELKLNEQYTAVVNHGTKTVTVCCQTFPFAKVAALYKTINKQK